MSVGRIGPLRLLSLQLISALALALLGAAWSPPAEAGNRYADCGGVGQRACCAFPEFRLPSCDSGLVEVAGGPGAGQGPLNCSVGTCYTVSFPSQCGGEGERACTIFEFPIACQTGLVQQLYAGTFYCRRIGADGYPTHCGGDAQRPCVATEKIPSCKPNHFEYPFGVLCEALVGGYPDFCGGQGQPACTLDLQILLAITPCKPGFVESRPFPGLCSALDADGYPAFCGGDAEPACDLDLQVGFGITSCKPGLAESPSIGGTCYVLDNLGYPGNCGDLDQVPCDLMVQTRLGIKACKGNRVQTLRQNPTRLVCDVCPVGENLFCPVGGEADFDRPPPQDWPATEAPQGPRTIFLIHGLGSSPGAGWRQRVGDLPGVLDDPRIAQTVYAVDYNADSDTPAPLRLYRLERLAQADAQGDWARWDLAYEHPSGALDGVSLTIFEVAGQIAAAIEAVPTTENITLVGHSLGGIMARQVVYRYYDELRNAGKRIAEVITLGSPHLGGGIGITEAGSSVIQEVLSCVGTELDLIGDPNLRRAANQACQLERWHLGREEIAQLYGITIDNRDYPQIRWATVASSGLGLSFSGLAALTFLDSDKVVATLSAFGIAADVCFPHQTMEAPGLPGYFGILPAVKTIDGDPAASATCYQPDQADDPHYEHVQVLVNGDGSPSDHSQLLVNRNTVCFAKSFVAGDLIEPDEDGDGVRYCQDNCSMVANPDQFDDDGDGYGNRCDADFDNSWLVNLGDLAVFRGRFGSANSEADLDHNGIVSLSDLAIFRALFGKPMGPSGTGY